MDAPKNFSANLNALGKSMSYLTLFNTTGMTTVLQSFHENESLYFLNNSNISTTASEQSFNTDEIATLHSIESYLWTYVSPVLILVGVFGNCLSIAVLKKMRFWRRTPLFLLVVLAVTDITVLLDGLLRYWINYAFKIDIRTLSNASCKINLFVIYIAMQYSSWILVCMIIDRFLKTNFPFLYMRVATMKKTCLIISVLFIILAGIDLHFFWTNGIKDGECDDLNQKYHNFGEFVFVYIDIVVLSALPFLIMLILNVFVYRALKRHHEFRSTSIVESRHSKRKRGNRRQFSKKLTRMLLFTSAYFLCSTVPISVYFIYDSYVKFEDDLNNAKKDVAWSVMYLFQYSNYSLNFVWYAAWNKVFREKAKEIFGFKPKGFRYQNATRKNNRRSSSISHMTTSIDNSINEGVSETYDEHSDYSEDIQTNASKYVDPNPNTQSASVSMNTYEHM
ncbi:psychosine receptor-like [Mytilus trossulus]|uniref:psychosine receptor-like n=1 Tax=Mytilus trossulus TaxID=6551 RepID=UPI003004D436